VHGTGVYFAGVGPKGPALERFLDIKKKKVLFELCFGSFEIDYRFYASILFSCCLLFWIW
jgi:hypothetical protein